MSQQILFVLAVAAVIAFWWLKRPTITSAEAHEAVARGARLVDVRSPSEFASGHLEGALNLPVGQLSARMGELGPKGTPIVVYCASGTRSAMAARKAEGGCLRIRPEPRRDGQLVTVGVATACTQGPSSGPQAAARQQAARSTSARSETDLRESRARPLARR